MLFSHASLRLLYLRLTQSITRRRNISIKSVLQECSGENVKVLKSVAALRPSSSCLRYESCTERFEELLEKSGRPIKVQLPTSLCQKLLVAWATPRYIKVQRGIGAGKCSDQPKLAQSPTTPVAKSGLPKAFPQVTAWGAQSAEALHMGPGPTMVYLTPCSKSVPVWEYEKVDKSHCWDSAAKR